MCMAHVFEDDGEEQRVPRQIRSLAKTSERRLKQILSLKKIQSKRYLDGTLSGEGEGQRLRKHSSLVKIPQRTVILL